MNEAGYPSWKHPKHPGEATSPFLDETFVNERMNLDMEERRKYEILKCLNNDKDASVSVILFYPLLCRYYGSK